MLEFGKGCEVMCMTIFPLEVFSTHLWKFLMNAGFQLSDCNLFGFLPSQLQVKGGLPGRFDRDGDHGNKLLCFVVIRT